MTPIDHEKIDEAVGRERDRGCDGAGRRPEMRTRVDGLIDREGSTDASLDAVRAIGTALNF